MPVNEGHTTVEVSVARSGVDTFSPSALRRRRELKGLTIGEVASLSGISAASLSNWENGKVVPTPANLAAVAHALGAEVADLAPVPAGRMRMCDLRHQAGLSQEDVAAAIAMSKATVTNIESGATRPNPTALTALASTFGIAESTVTTVWEATQTARMTRLRAR